MIDTLRVILSKRGLVQKTTDGMFPFVSFLRKQNYRDRKQILWLLGTGNVVGGHIRGFTSKEHGKIWGMMESFSILFVVMVIQLTIYVGP